MQLILPKAKFKYYEPNYQVRSAPDARRPLQKSQNGVDTDQDHAAPQS